MKICFECKNTCLQLNVSFTDSKHYCSCKKKLSIAYAFQASSLIQVFWVGGGGGEGAVSIVFICMFIYVLLQVKSVDRNQ